MSKAFSLCCTLDEAKAVREEVAFLQAVKVILTKRDITACRRKPTSSAKRPSGHHQPSKVVSESVVDMLMWAGQTIDLLDDEFLAQVKNLPNCNWPSRAAGAPAGGRKSNQVRLRLRGCETPGLRLLSNVIARYQNHQH